MNEPELEKQLTAAQAVARRLKSELTEERATIEQLQKALAIARRVSAAIGILMTEHHLTETDALRLLLQVSQDNHSLHDIADDIESPRVQWTVSSPGCGCCRGLI